MARRWDRYGDRYGFRPYVSVAKRRANAQRYAANLAKKGHDLQPVEIEGRVIARTFWGKAWCDNLESYSDFENRLPRGRTYVRNGSVVDLQIAGGRVTSIVSGSDIYKIKIEIAPLTKGVWTKIKQDCSRSIDSLIDLLQGRFSKAVMERLTRQKEGLFPQPREIEMSCSCPDWAGMCKHVAATLYGVGARLDTDPQLLFRLREVDHLELVSQAASGANLDQALHAESSDTLSGEDLGEIFGIDLEQDGPPAEPAGKPARKSAKRPRAKGAQRPTSAARTQQRQTKAKKRAKRPVAAAIPAPPPDSATASQRRSARKRSQKASDRNSG